MSIIKRSIDRDRKHAGGACAGHLTFLQGGHFSVGIENEDPNPGEPHQAVDGRCTRVTGGCPEDGDRNTGALDLDGIEPAEELQCEILEGQCWTMKELTGPQVGLQLPNRSDVRMVKRGIRSIHAFAE
ncbi:MAG: hypothetical protein BWY82_01994 [Verrucomicrobia bacterium ADurb.Bin474]|nr:MAG: hypothetical protein BWY82_01994 [Verrucomicrobia bacterium ADurb.Bin474]